jgi:hypothetical protein
MKVLVRVVRELGLEIESEEEGGMGFAAEIEMAYKECAVQGEVVEREWVPDDTVNVDKEVSREVERMVM